MKILIATHNPAKLEEILSGLKELLNYGVELISLDNLKIKSEPEEHGVTFCDNSLLKAQYYAKLSNLPVVADDGGLGIDILNGEPGVKSKRWVGHEGTDDELIAYTLKRLQGVAKDKRSAYLQTCVYFYDPVNKISFSETEKIEGYISEKPSGKPTNGYPFRALFVVKSYDKYYDELTVEEHNGINHRLKALKKLVKKIKIYYKYTFISKSKIKDQKAK